MIVAIASTATASSAMGALNVAIANSFRVSNGQSQSQSFKNLKKKKSSYNNLQVLELN